MPAKRKYQPEHVADVPALPGSLPLDYPVAVYYRQSSMKQVGNISTDMQQIDLPRYVNSLGWSTYTIILIDEDEGVSGAKRIDERKDMSRLYDLIITGRIGTRSLCRWKIGFSATKRRFKSMFLSMLA